LEDNRIEFSQKSIIDNGTKTVGAIVHDTEATTTISFVTELPNMKRNVPSKKEHPEGKF
jgi:hypothetical protein